MSIEESNPVARPLATPLGAQRRSLRSLASFARRQPLGLAALVVVILIAFLAAFAPFLHTSDPQHSV